MSDQNREPMLQMFIFETTQLLEQLEQVIINNEKNNSYDQGSINEIFRIMHTIKGSSAMMEFEGISSLSHAIEDLFDFLRNETPVKTDFQGLNDLIFESIDFIKTEIFKIENQNNPDGDSSSIIEKINNFLPELKKINSKLSSEQTVNAVQNYEDSENMLKNNLKAQQGKDLSYKRYKAIIYFEEGCQMENMRAFAVIKNLREFGHDISFIPSDIINNNNSADVIKNEGFQVWFETSRNFNEVHHFFSQILFLKDLELVEIKSDNQLEYATNKQNSAFNGSLQEKNIQNNLKSFSSHQSIISVNVYKLDKLMDLVGELVISEAMVTQNPDLKDLELDNFKKAAGRHRKIINELQDIVMSIRMVPLSSTLQRMKRTVRDMSKKLSKKVELKIIGEETEVDKNIIEHITDPIMHLIRNSMDHGIESAEERRLKGKPETGTITIEAKNSGNDVLIIINDDGKGLDREKILLKAKKNGLVNKPEKELTDKEIYSYIFLPGFSTSGEVTEFSGRGVGMDVVSKNIGSVGGTVSVDSMPDHGTTVTMKIPLTLAIIDGMLVKTGETVFTIPTINIKESLKVKEESIITDPDGNEIIMIRGNCYPVLRLHEIYKIETKITSISEGIIIMAENNGKGLCLFADQLLGQQHVVVKALPNYIKRIKNIRGLAGCTLLGDGSISLILDIEGLSEL
jgi:two-component system chemotaxis sensor kinase CheA